MANPIEEQIGSLEEAGARYIYQGDLEKSLACYHDRFLGWPEVGSDLVDKKGMRQIIENDIELAVSYDFEIERLGFRLFENTETTHLLFHCSGRISDGVEFDESYRWTHTWIRDESQWTLLTGVSYEIDKS